MPRELPSTRSLEHLPPVARWTRISLAPHRTHWNALHAGNIATPCQRMALNEWAKVFFTVTMANDLLTRLKQGPVLCDGAMGTLLYAKGVFINKCYDELNLTQPDLIRGIHQEYMNAGAEIIETNTFGGNSFRLGRHGLADKVEEVNRKGAELAREAADAFNLKKATDVLVAGSIGPLGLRIEPLGKTSREEARTSFREQITALVAGGVDVLMLETFGYLEELHQAILAAREVAPEKPLVAQVTIDEEGNCLDGASPETFTAKLNSWSVDVIGCNCSVGPVAMLEAIERIRRLTDKPLAAQPNAGIPRSIEGRNIYLCSPEYMASYARKFVNAGVNLVGGCCGTTPEHTKSMKSALRMTDAKGKPGGFRVITEAKRESSITPPPLSQRSNLGKKLAAGEFVTLVEIVPPKGIDFRKEVEGAKFLKAAGIDAINIPDSPRASARMSNMALCLLVQQQAGIETVLHFTCRDRNVLSMQSELLGAYTTGLHNLICITGDPPKLGNYPDATAVFDVDAIGLVNIVHNLNHGLDVGGNPIGSGTKFMIGVGANPGIVNIDEEVRRFEYKVEAGADFAVTQPVFDVSLLEQFLRRVDHHRIPVLAGIWPLTSVRNAEFMKNELRVSVPDAILERMARAANAEAARAEGILIAREMLHKVRGLVQGAQVAAPLGRYSSAIEVLDGIGSATAAG
jgi:methionine synthase / methylenetetrahydrofolate reductase(NADPH)